MAGNRSLGSLTVDLILKLGGWTQGWTKAEREANTRSKSIQRSMMGLKSAITGAFAVLGGGLLIRGIIRATAEAEKSFALLSNAVQASGGAAGYSAKQLSAMAEELQQLSTYSDEAIQDAEALLLRFQSIQGVNFERALQSTLDLATALGKDLSSSAILVGKSLEDPIKGMGALAKAGVVLGKEQKELIKNLAESGKQSEAQALLLAELEKRYKGAALAARQNFGGALEGLKNDIDNLLEAKDGLPAMTESINDLSEVIQDPEFRAGFDAFVSGILKVIAAVAGGAAGLANFATWVGETFSAINNGVQDGDLVRMSDEIIALRENIEKLRGMGDFRQILQGGSENVALQIDTDVKKLAELEAAYKRARAAAEAAHIARTAPPGAPGPNTPTPEAPPSEEFLKLEASLKEQIALHGKVTEVAKLSYQIQAGELDKLTEKEQARALALAAQIDKLNELDVIGKQTRENIADLEKSLKESAKEFEDTFKLTPESVEDAYADMAKAAETIWSESGDRIVTESAEKFSAFADEMKRNMQDILGDGLYDAMTGNFDDILGAFEDMITKMVAQALAAKLNEKLFGADGAGGGLIDMGLNFLSGLFGGGMATGGPVNAGHLYRVNEAGTEMLTTSKGDYLMMGSEGGNITPAGKVGGGSVNQKIYVTGTVTERTARQIALATASQQRAAMRLA